VRDLEKKPPFDIESNFFIFTENAVQRYFITSLRWHWLHLYC